MDTEALPIKYKVSARMVKAGGIVWEIRLDMVGPADVVADALRVCPRASDIEVADPVLSAISKVVAYRGCLQGRAQQ